MAYTSPKDDEPLVDSDEDVSEDQLSGPPDPLLLNSEGAEPVYTVEEAVEKLGFGVFQVLVTIFSGLLWLADAMELMLLSILSPAVKCQWGLSSGEEAAITSVVFIGFLIGSFFWGVVCDLVGRKTGLFIVNVLILVFGVLSAIPVSSDESAKFPGYPWLLICRCGVGFGAGGATQSVTYYVEFLPKKARGVCITFQEVWWAIGSMLGAGLAVGVMVPGGLGWHWYLGLSTIPLFLVLFLFVFVPESARYYIVKGKYEKAAKVIKTIAKYNCKVPPKGRIVSFEEKQKIDQSKSTLSDTVLYSQGTVTFSESSHSRDVSAEEKPLLDEELDEPSSTSYEVETHLDSRKKCLVKFKEALCGLYRRASIMFKDRMWITTVILFMLWFGAAWLYYGIVLLTTQFLQNDPHCGITNNASNLSCEETQLDREDYLFILWTAAAELPGLLVTVLVIEVIGRKFTIASEFVLTMIGFLLLFICSTKLVLTVFLFFIRAFSSGVFQAIYVYTPEVYPTSVRAFALGSCSAFARVGAIATPYIAQVLVEHSDIATISLYGGSCVILAVLACLLPIETKGRSLQDEKTY